MITTFAHGGLQLFFRTGDRTGINPPHAARLRLQLGRLDAATMPADMDQPGWDLRRPAGDRGQWSVAVAPGWRLAFTFAPAGVLAVDYLPTAGVGQ